jgi:hypothetical protein
VWTKAMRFPAYGAAVAASALPLAGAVVGDWFSSLSKVFISSDDLLL